MERCEGAVDVGDKEEMDEGTEDAAEEVRHWWESQDLFERRL